MSRLPRPASLRLTGGAASIVTFRLPTVNCRPATSSLSFRSPSAAVAFACCGHRTLPSKGRRHASCLARSARLSLRLGLVLTSARTAGEALARTSRARKESTMENQRRQSKGERQRYGVRGPLEQGAHFRPLVVGGVRVPGPASSGILRSRLSTGRVRRRAEPCECGSRKRVADRACGACEWLDGASAAEARLIAVLRILSGPTPLRAIAQGARLSERQVLRTVKTLVARGRLKKLVAGEEREFGERTGSRVAATYVLTDRRRRVDDGVAVKPAAQAA